MLGGSSSSWPRSAKWLMMLEVKEVSKWFEAKIKNGRLGDHFAFCVEYVLRFSPVVRAKHLLISQQVSHQVFNSSLKVPTPVDEATHRCDGNSSSPVEQLNVSPKIRVELLGREVLIKLYGYIDRNTCAEELATAIMKKSSCDLHASVFKDANVSQDFRSLTLQDEQETSCESMPVGAVDRSSGRVGKRKRKSLQKLQRLKDGKGSTLTIGEFDFLFLLDGSVEQVRFSEGLCLQGTSDMTKWSLWKDSLATNAEASMQSRQHMQEMNVNHWEVSVKFLLYAGPWEMFGLETPSYAAWKNKNQDFQEGSPVFELNGETTPHDGDSNCKTSAETSQAACGSALKDAWHMNEFLGCFLGPHIGETLSNRKTRLINQLSLSHNIHAASLLCRLFNLTSTESDNIELCSGKELIVDKTPAEKLTCTPKCNACTVSESLHSMQNKQQAVKMGTERVEMMRVSPRALLQGYLFYEYDLWCHLGQNGNYVCDRHLIQTEFWEGDLSTEHINKDGSNWEDGKECSGEVIKHASKLVHAKTHSKPRLNPKHWQGWWSHVSNFTKFALSPVHEHSRWYIVPKKEWLSPVVIEEEAAGITRKVLNVDEILAMAAKAAEEADTLQIPQKRRFMVAEMIWVSQELARPSGLKCDKQQVCFNRLVASCGKWEEVSRGFVVEDTWPDSRLYLPHGYSFYWSPKDT